jgi:hypothetical protein
MTMRTTAWLAFGVWAGWMGGCAPQRSEPGSEHAAIAQSPAARGEYLVSILACDACHTPWIMTDKGPAPDATRLLMGHPMNEDPGPPPALPAGGWGWAGAMTNTAFAGPWGVSYATNLTPHESGLGVWSEDMFVTAIRSGMHMGAGRTILPPMPWQAYGKMTDDDLRAIFAYLKTIPPIENAAPQSVPAPPPGS